MKKLALITLLLLSTCLCSGCVIFVLGAGAAGAVAATHDKVRLQYDTSFERAWQATHKALDYMGIVNSEDKKARTIEATIEESYVLAKITPVTAQSMTIEIKVRKNLLPNMDLANKILNDINNRLHLDQKTKHNSI